MSDGTGHKGLVIPHPKIGMRTVKTVVAVFICCMIDYLRGEPPYQSTIAAIICIQPDTENTVKMAVARILATLLGGVSAALLLMALTAVGMTIPSIPFFLILSLLLFPLIYVTVKMGWPSATALTCIVFLVIALGHTEGSAPFMVAMTRMVDTLVGILVALPVNMLLPTRPVPAACEPEGEQAAPPVDQPACQAEPEKPAVDSGDKL